MATAISRPATEGGPGSAIIKGGGALAIFGVLLFLGINTGVCADRLATWIQLTTTGLTLGAIYAMIALGYTMVYGVLQLLNFAHSEVFMIGSFAGVYVVTDLFGITDAKYPNGLGGAHLILVLVVGLLLAALASGLTAVAMERVAYRPLRKGGAPRLGYLITAIGVSLFLSNLFLLLDGGEHLGLPFTWPHIGGREPVLYPDYMHRTTVFRIFGVQVQNLQLLVILVAVGMLIVLDLFVRRTRAGQGIRAVAEDPETASLMGVDINRVIVLTFFVGGLMAGGAGLLYGTFYGQTQWNIGFIPGIKAFTAAVLGGIGNVRGAILGGVLLGLIENLGVACTGTQWQAVIAFAVLVGVLMFRPTGLLGEQVGG
ncbi:MAG TPA: branched-chain amino acid ABC transporter permease [Actinomycetota bacterium]|nr:branched-chain amino acid ABC transporter permease [Actinomycetota bacterium]